MSGSDRYAAMQWPHDGPCPTCGSRPDGIPTYRPTHAKPLTDQARAAYIEFSETRGPNSE